MLMMLASVLVAAVALPLLAAAATGQARPSTPTQEPRPIDTSLATIPTGYFGGSGATGGGAAGSYRRSDAEIAQLARQRVVVVEKWEGPCWDGCLANSSRKPPVACSPGCGEEAYQLDTLRRVKAVNPNVSGVFYLNTLYDFPYYSLAGTFAAADLHLRDVHGAVVGLQNDNGMLDVPVFDFGQPAAVKLFLGFHAKLVASGLVDGTFPDKANERAFRTGNGTWWLCENPGGPPPAHSWAAACGELTEAKALAYNDGKAQMLMGLARIYGEKGALWPIGSAGVARNGTVCSRQAPCVLAARGRGVDFSAAVAKHAQLVQTLREVPYVYFMQGDAHGTGLATRCTPDDVMLFLLVVEEGMVLGCNGWGAAHRTPEAAGAAIPPSWWVSRLGNPLGPPALARGVVSRSFDSGVRVRYDLAGGNGTVDGWDLPTPTPTPKPPPPAPPLPGRCGAPLVDYGFGQHDIVTEERVAAGPGECCDHCQSVARCVAWAWHHEQGNACHVHSAGATKSDTKHPGCISGFMNASHPA